MKLSIEPPAERPCGASVIGRAYDGGNTIGDYDAEVGRSRRPLSGTGFVCVVSDLCTLQGGCYQTPCNTRYPEVHQAIMLRQNRAVCLEVEARVLAKEPVEQIAEKLAVPPQAVVTFAALFFDVSGRLHASSWVTHQVIRLHDNLPKKPLEQLGRLWKLYGYWAGSLVLDDLIYDISVQRQPTSPEETQQFFQQEAIKIIQRKVCLALRLMRVDDPKEALKLMRAMQRIHESERRKQQQHQTGPEMNFMRNVRATLEQLPPGYMEMLEKSCSNGEAAKAS